MSAAGEPVSWEPTAPPLRPIPERTRAWLRDELGAEIVGIEPLHGGISSSIHRVDLARGDLPTVVVRRYTLDDWLAREPHIPAHEAHVLSLLPGLAVGVATPELLAADPDGAHTDVPTIVMTHLAGRPDLSPAEPSVWAERQAACLAAIHAVDPPSGLPAFRRWDDARRGRPRWLVGVDAWDEAVALVAGPEPAHRPRLLHRDFHPANLLWHGGEIVGVVDWLGACVGSAAADLAHCRWNLAMLHSHDLADHFLDHYRSLTGHADDVTFHDLVTVLSAPIGEFPTFAWQALGRTDLTPAVVHARIERWLAHLVDRGR